MHPATPCTPPPQSHSQEVHTVTAEDLEILDQITAPDFRSTADVRFRRRDNDFDPLIIATAITGSDRSVTRHHYLHGDIGIYSSSDSPAKPRGPAQSHYVSQQKPRHQRLKEELAAAGGAGTSTVIRVPAPGLSTQEIQTSLENPSSPTVSPKNRRPSLLLRPSSPKPSQATVKSIKPAHVGQAPAPLVADALSSTSSKPQHDSSAANSVRKPVSRDRRPPLVVQCRARTRVPTPHGPVFLHLYHNNWDAKEHLAIVIDQAQLEDVSEDGTGTVAPPIRSRSLDAQYEGETEMDRITRGAYVGRLSPTRSVTSKPVVTATASTTDSAIAVATPSYPAPLIRIHSECFTGETIGSMRCDCGEQLDEAMRLIAQPQPLSNSHTTIPGRGAVVYLRQEGRGIGLLEKIKAYNLQDLGHDTVTANLMLGHGADERGYEIAAAILRDLGLGGEEEGVRVLTNNPEKMGALQAEGVKIVERVPMVPRTWKCQDENPALIPSTSEDGRDVEYELRRAGATLIGATTTRSVELEKYLRTKVQRMGHMLDLPTPAPTTPGSSSGSDPTGESEADLISQDEDDHLSISFSSGASTPGLDSLASSLAPSRMGVDGLGTPSRSRSVSPTPLSM